MRIWEERFQKRLLHLFLKYIFEYRVCVWQSFFPLTGMYVRKSTSSKIAEYIRCMLIWWIHAPFTPRLHLQSASILVAPFFRRAMAMITSTKRPYQWWTLDVLHLKNTSRHHETWLNWEVRLRCDPCHESSYTLLWRTMLLWSETRKTYGYLARLGVKRYPFPFIKKSIKLPKK